MQVHQPLSKHRWVPAIRERGKSMRISCSRSTMLSSVLGGVGIALCTLPLTATAEDYDPSEFATTVLTVVSNLPGPENIYTFDVLAFNNEWVPTVIVFGYPNNASACDSILRPAEKQSPSRTFRCNLIDKSLYKLKSAD